MKAPALLLLLLLTTHAFSQRERNYPQTAFDSDTCCWRKLSKAGQHHEAAQLIADYIDNSPNAVNKHSLNWHAGQAYAMAGDTKLAVAHFKKTYNLFYRWFGDEDGRAWYYFAKGNISFVERDKAKLERIIARWEKQLPLDNNYNELALLLMNWEMDYKEAYKD